MGDGQQETNFRSRNSGNLVHTFLFGGEQGGERGKENDKHVYRISPDARRFNESNDKICVSAPRCYLSQIQDISEMWSLISLVVFCADYSGKLRHALSP